MQPSGRVLPGPVLRWAKSPERQVWLFALAVCAALFGTVSWRVALGFDAEFRKSRVTATNLARSVADHANSTIQVSQSVLTDMVYWLQVDGTSPLALGRLHQLLVTQGAAMPTIKFLLVFSASGDTLTASFEPTPVVNVADRSYFAWHRDHPDTNALIGPPLVGRQDGRWSMTISRRFNTPDGSFGGVAVAVVDLDTFNQFYASFDVGAHGAIALLKEDRTVVVRYPPPPDPDYRTKPLPLIVQGNAGNGRSVSPLDGVARLYSYRRTADAPLFAFVSLSEDDILAPAWRDTWNALAVCAALSAAFCLLGWRLAKQIRLREEREVATRRREERYRLLADYSSDLIIKLGPDLHQQYVSPASEGLLGYRPEELLGGDIRDTIHPEDRSLLEENIGELLRSDMAASVRYRLRSKSGEFVWVETVGRTLGGGKGFVVTVRDVTHRKLAEDMLHKSNSRLSVVNAELECLAQHLTQARDEAELASRAKTRFLAGVSHELRTPLNGILGYAHLLRMEAVLPPVQAARVDAMLGAGAHLLDMINRVLDLSEIETEHAQLYLSEVDPREVAGASLDLVRPAAEAKGLAVEFTVSSDVPQRITTDPTRLRQVLVNLLGNAVKFTSAGSVLLGLHKAPYGTGLQFTVTDTGSGIPAAKRDHLFKEFERLDADVNGAVEGAGLGLALSARLAVMLGGRLGHMDNSGGGSVFWFELPLRAGSTEEVPPDAAAAPELRQAEPAVAGPLRVLVVDDVAMNREIAAAFLSSAGHAVVCAESGEEAINAVRIAAFDVVLMDVRMPRMDGLEATRRIRSLGGVQALVPIVALTAQAFTEQIDECRHAGMQFHVAKPFDPKTLLATVERAAKAGPARAAGGPVALIPTGTSGGATVANPPAAIGQETPILDQVVFDRTAAVLSCETLTASLASIAERAEYLLRGLRAPGGAAKPGDDLSETAHILAGSAGMFGLARLSKLARRFEHDHTAGAPETTAVAIALAEAIELSLSVIRGLAQAAAAEPMASTRLQQAVQA
ncbi:MAG: hypothetical protein NVSMB18_10750 [Acetobacteraceae bacterium]